MQFKPLEIVSLLLLCVGTALVASCSKSEAPAPESAAPADAAPAAPVVVDAAPPAGAASAGANNGSEEGSIVYLPQATVQRDAIWKLKTWEGKPDKEIEVCWENPEATTKPLRDLMAKSVADTWAKVSMLKFTGWEKCPAESKGIRIFINDEGPHVKALGRYLANYPHGMVLNFTFANWSTSCQQRVEFCASTIAVHEFGHAIGFAHEQNRADAPWECSRDYHQGTAGDWNLTEYDPDSVMNYCNTKYNNNGNLSPRDVQAAQLLYTARPAT